MGVNIFKSSCCLSLQHFLGTSGTEIHSGNKLQKIKGNRLASVNLWIIHHKNGIFEKVLVLKRLHIDVIKSVNYNFTDLFFPHKQPMNPFSFMSLIKVYLRVISCCISTFLYPLLLHYLSQGSGSQHKITSPFQYLNNWCELLSAHVIHTSSVASPQRYGKTQNTQSSISRRSITKRPNPFIFFSTVLRITIFQGLLQPLYCSAIQPTLSHRRLLHDALL
ncbi:hypothetical protein ABPG72_013993 [Tetrahymena utriculariae]